MLINVEYSIANGVYKASTNWMSPEWRCVTTVGTSNHSEAEAIGNMILQMSASVGSPVVLTFTEPSGNVILQPKM
jgi:hypothetical protein